MIPAATTNYAGEHPVVFSSVFLALVVLGAARLWLLHSKDNRFSEHAGLWRVLVCITIAVSGFAWGLFGAAANYLHTEDPVETLLVTICVLGISIGGLPVLAPEVITLRIFLSAALTPIILANVLVWDRTHFGVAAVVLLFLGFLFTQAATLSAEYWKNLRDNVLLTQRARELETAKIAAEAASRSKSEFLTNISHEIRTPMNGIIGMTSVVLEGDMTADQRDCLNTVRFSADSLLILINDLLDFSKIEAGRLDFECIPFELRELLAGIVAMLQFQAAQKGIDLGVSVDAAVPDALSGDPWRLRQVIVNLAGNAIKFTEQGWVRIEVRLESVDSAGALLHFAVADSGIGIPLEKQQTIFEAFSQADGSITRRYGGTGLGLTISSRLVEIFGGRIWLESEAGQGSTFHFTARFQETRQEISAGAVESGISGAPHQVSAV